MEPFFIIIIAGVAMSLISVLLVAIYFILEADNKKKEIRRYARRQIIRQMELDKQLQAKMQEKVDL